jgi:excisionase family DNA binding protein
MKSVSLPSTPIASPWLNPEQAAAYLGVALGTLRNWVSAKYIPHVKRGRVVRFHREKLDAWLRRGECSGRLEHADTIQSKYHKGE